MCFLFSDKRVNNKSITNKSFCARTYDFNFLQVLTSDVIGKLENAEAFIRTNAYTHLILELLLDPYSYLSF
jgi:hypothetical protein